MFCKEGHPVQAGFCHASLLDSSLLRCYLERGPRWVIQAKSNNARTWRRRLAHRDHREGAVHAFGASRYTQPYVGAFVVDQFGTLERICLFNCFFGIHGSQFRRRTSANPAPHNGLVMLFDGVFRQFQSFLEALRRTTPLSEGSGKQATAVPRNAPDLPADFYDDDEEGLIPLVLVAGAAGRTGRLIVRKLLLQGFRVRALVRNLSPETLDELGTGCEYAKADLLDKDSLLEAVYGVDKVICTISGDSGREEEAVSNLLKAFQDARFLEFGRRDSAKVTIFKLNRPRHFSLWSCPENQQTTMVTATSREENTTDSDTLAAAKARNSPNLSNGGLIENSRLRDRLSSTVFELNNYGNAVFRGKLRDVYRGQAEVFTTNFSENPLNFSGFSGMILRCLGDGQRYSLVIRTRTGNANGMQFISTFSTMPARKWITVRLAFPDFVPQRLSDRALLRGEIRDATVFDFSEITQIGIQYEARENLTSYSFDGFPSRKGTFYLTMDYLKAFRTQDEPEFILVSCMGVQRDLVEITRKRDIEEALKTCGLSYCIMRTGVLTDEPGGLNSIAFDQTQIENRDLSTGLVAAEVVRTPFAKKISRADVADVCVASLLDARACNVTFDLFDSPYAPTTRAPTRNYSALFETLKPNT
ncbi:hypothetical protein CCYA_CCYA01G0275 [Cyanidiococcus yangmingshanensis]|nr:hypothetical protein CCYA_CCYA01G0275 [Cyanidiococcus yangmingshanensis]